MRRTPYLPIDDRRPVKSPGAVKAWLARVVARLPGSNRCQVQLAGGWGKQRKVGVILADGLDPDVGDRVLCMKVQNSPYWIALARVSANDECGLYVGDA